MNTRLVYSNTQKSNEVRRMLWALVGLITLETVAAAVIVYFLMPTSWTLVLALTIVIGIPLVTLSLIVKILNSKHVIMTDALKLGLSRFNLITSLSEISEIKQFSLTLVPCRDAIGLSICRQDDTLYVLSRNSDIIQISLSSPILVRAKAFDEPYAKQGLVKKIVFNVDEPTNFLKELRGKTRLDPTQTLNFETTTVSPSTPIFNARDLNNSTVSIEIKSLQKLYGDYLAVNNLMLDIYEGEMFGFLGVNGAGKSTTIKMMTGLLKPTRGQILIKGQDLWQPGSKVRRSIGYIPDTPLVYERLTGREMLTMAGKLYGLSNSKIDDKIEELLFILRLEEWANSLIGIYSMGMQRKLSVALALLADPDIIIVDELTNAFDPQVLAEIKAILENLRNEGKTVLLSTHVMDVAEKLCDRIGIIHRGELVAVGAVSELSESLGLEGGLESLFLHLIDNDNTVRGVS